MTEFIGVTNVSALLFASVLDCLNSDSIAIWLTDDAVLPQDVVSDVFQLRHNSNSRVRAPFNEIRLAFHRLTSFSLLSSHQRNRSTAACDDLRGCVLTAMVAFALLLSLHVKRRS
jgi:hypothetical protein